MDERYVTTRRGTKIRYLEGGDGPPLLLFHELAVSASADYWRPFLGTIGEVRHYYAFDTPGWGYSDRLDEYSFDGWLETVEDLCVAVNLERIDILSMSLGAWNAQLFAWKYPHRVRALVAWESPGVNPAPPPESNQNPIPTREYLEKEGHHDAEAIDRIMTSMARPGVLENWNKIWECVKDPAKREQWTMKTRLPEMQTPIQFGNVDANWYIPMRYTYEMFTLAPNARLEISCNPFSQLIQSLLPGALRFLQFDEFPTAAK